MARNRCTHLNLTRCVDAARVVALTVALALGAPNAHIAEGQVDTPAAREARAILAEVQRTYGSSSELAPWQRKLALKDVSFELRAGDRAEHVPLEWAAARLRSGVASTFRDPVFQRLAGALEKRAVEIAPILASKWPAEC